MHRITYPRYNMKLEEFYRECELRLKPEVARSVPKAVLAVSKCLRGLVSRLPFLQRENAGQLKQTKLIHYVDDVLKVDLIFMNVWVKSAKKEQFPAMDS